MYREKPSTGIVKIRESSGCNQKSKIILLFINIGECIKCSVGAKATIDSIATEIGDNSICTVAVVRCNRAIELKIFSRNNNWTQPIYADDGTLKDNLNLPKDTRLAVYDAQNVFMGSLKREDFNPTAYNELDSILHLKY